jgi:hypothetical protein
MQFSRLLGIPILIFICILGYFILKNDWVYLSIYIGIAFVSLAIIFVFSPQIDYWWWSKYTPKLNKPVQKIFSEFKPEYLSLSQDRKRLFDRRIFLYTRGQDFEFKDIDGSPEDLKAIIAYYPVMLSLNRKEFLLAPFDKIVLFRKKFLSPSLKQEHASEANLDDKVMIFALDYLVAAFRNPVSYFDIALYEFVQVYEHLFKSLSEIVIQTSDIDEMRLHKMWHPELLKSGLGYDKVDLLAMTVVNLYTFSEIFKEQLPDLYSRMINRVEFLR